MAFTAPCPMAAGHTVPLRIRTQPSTGTSMVQNPHIISTASQPGAPG